MHLYSLCQTWLNLKGGGGGGAGGGCHGRVRLGPFWERPAGDRSNCCPEKNCWGSPTKRRDNNDNQGPGRIPRVHGPNTSRATRNEKQITGIETVPRTKQVPFWRFLLRPSPGSPSELLPLCPSAGGIGHGEEHEVAEDSSCPMLFCTFYCTESLRTVYLCVCVFVRMRSQAGVCS